MPSEFRVSLADNGVYRHSVVMRDPDDGNALIYSLPEQFDYQPHPGMITYAVQSEQTLHDICMSHYSLRGFRYPWRTAEVIAQFQPRPVIDLSVPLRIDTVIYLPSVDWLEDALYGDTLTEIPELL